MGEGTPPARYDPSSLEPRWQERWRTLRVFEAVMDPGRPKYYCYNPAPYVTGALHMGHVRNYTCGDFVAKFRKLRGAAVLYTIGFDAYGLPTEMAAIRNGVAPEQWTADCLKEMTRQLVSLGLGLDWRRTFLTSDPRYYRWTQWIFLQLLSRDLVYSAAGTAQWCPRCETSLARAQVEEGRCWICGSPVERRRVREWRLRISRILPDLLGGLETMRDLIGLAERGQRELIGLRRGFRVDLRTAGEERVIRAFLARREDWLSPCVLAVHAKDEETLRWLGGRSFAVEVRSEREPPVVIREALDPAFVDQPVILAEGEVGGANLPEFPPLTISRQKDFSISRQRVWGTPIPVVLCASCGEVPLAIEALPVLAPRIVYDAASRRLIREDPQWDLRDCPRCGRAARLDPQVMDCHMDSLWHPFRPCAREGTEFLFEPSEMRYWMPADIIQFGRDVIPFMLDLRFLSYFLHDLGEVPFREFCRDVLAHGLVIHEGRKMSKHLGNVVTPEEIIREHGADSLRFYILAHAEPKSDFRWSQEGIRRYRELLESYHAMIREVAPGMRENGPARTDRPGPATAGTPGPASFGRYTNIFFQKAEREIALMEKSVDPGRYERYAGALERLLAGMEFFRSNHLAREQHPEFGPLWREMVYKSVFCLAPVAPHLAEECWQLLGNDESLFARARLVGGGTGRLEES